MTPRLLREHDVPSLMRLKAAAGWNQTEADWLRVLRLQPDGCFGIDVDSELAASATAILYGEELSWIGMVLTLPEYRGKGLARRLMEHAIAFAGSRAVRLDASDMGKPLYASLGFVDECAIERWARPAGDAPGERKLQPSSPDLALDREAFGADRSHLLAELARGGERVCVGREGHAFARGGSGAAYFGPCVSRSASGAREMLGWFLAAHGHVPTFWDLFPHHDDAVAIARAHGFAPVRRLTRMVYGAPPELPHRAVYGIAGFEFG